MSAARKSHVAVWRDAVRDSELDRTAKAVGLVLSTYMNGRGLAWPSQDTLAAGASLTDRAVYKATLRLEEARFLDVEWSRGRGTHKYAATLPATANAVRRSEWENSEPGSPFNSERHAPNGEPHASNGERRSGESAESAESGGAARNAAAEEEHRCIACDRVFAPEELDNSFCRDCVPPTVTR